MFRLILLLCFNFSVFFTLSAQAPFLHHPLGLLPQEEYYIVNYVDWSIDSISDYQCLSKTYDGHQGTDFALKSFVQMDLGVPVLAAADGMVTFIQEDLFDREKESDLSKGLGNYVAIRHPNLYYTYYGHLKKNSITVQPGMQVIAGDTIGYVASSGNSTDPHLHFELWYDSTVVVDPFAGPCGNATSLWLDTIAYDTTFKVWDHGMAEEAITLDALRERQNLLSCCPFRFEHVQEKPVYYWSLLNGLRRGDTLTIQWWNPDNLLWFTYDFPVDNDYWYYYFWTYIEPGELQNGAWHVNLLRNSQSVDNIIFEVNNKISNKEPVNPQRQIATTLYYDMLGKRIDSHSIEIGRPILERVIYTDGTSTIIKLIQF